MIGVWVLLWPEDGWERDQGLDAAWLKVDIFFDRLSAEKEFYAFANNNDLITEGDDNDWWASDKDMWEGGGTTYAYLQYKEVYA